MDKEKKEKEAERRRKYEEFRREAAGMDPSEWDMPELREPDFSDVRKKIFSPMAPVWVTAGFLGMLFKRREEGMRRKEEEVKA